MRIEYDTLVGLGVMPDVARGIVNDLSMRRMQGQESGVEVDDSLTFENLKGLGMSDEQATGLMNDAAMQRHQQQQNAMAYEAQQAGIAQERAAADEQGAIRADQRAALMGRKEDITANLQALNIARMADAGQLVPGAEQTDPQAEARRQALLIASGTDAAGQPIIAPAEYTDQGRQQYLHNVHFEEAAEREAAQKAAEQAKAARAAELATLETAVNTGQQQVDSLTNRAALQALMNASAPIAPRTFGEAMKGTPTTAQAEMTQNINLAREFFGRQGKVQRGKLKELEAERRMKRHQDKEARLRDQMRARRKRHEESEGRKERAHEDRMAWQEELWGPEGVKTGMAAARLEKMDEWRGALMFERRLDRRSQLKLANDKEGRRVMSNKASRWDTLMKEKRRESDKARERGDRARRDLEKLERSIDRDDTRAKQNRKDQLESIIYNSEEAAAKADRRAKVYERSASQAQRILDLGSGKRNTLHGVMR